MKKQHVLIFSTLLLLIIVVTSTYLFRGSQDNKVAQTTDIKKDSQLVRWTSPKQGSNKAKVTLVEFLDPACETCSQFHPFVKKLLASHPGKLKLVVRHAPFHHGSDVMVKILEAAKVQGKYWETLEVMLKTQPYWTSNHKAQPEQFFKYLPSIGLNEEQIRKGMDSPGIAILVEQDIADTIGLGIKKTPGFFVNGKPLSRFGYDELQNLVESEIRKNYQ